jgi:hypothetical protein
MRKIKFLGFLVILLQAVSIAQAQSVRPPEEAACGPSDAKKLAVHTDRKRHPLGTVDPSRALIYIFQESYVGPFLTLRYGLDGSWIGANHGDNGYFFSNVDAGDHHICGELQGPSGPTIFHPSLPVSVVGLSAKVGQVYYFLAQVASTNHDLHILVEPIGADEGKLLIARSGFSTWK